MDINIVLMGQRIRSARKEKKISSEVLAEKVGIAVESLWHIENGARNISLQTLCNIAEALDVPVDYLLGRMDSLFQEGICKLYDEKDYGDTEPDCKAGYEHLLPLLTEEQKMSLEQMESTYIKRRSYAAIYGFKCGLFGAFRQYFGASQAQDGGFQDLVCDDLLTQPRMQRHHENFANIELCNEIDRTIMDALSDDNKEHMVSVVCAWLQRVYSAAMDGFYCGYRVAYDIMEDIIPLVKVQNMDKILTLEYHLGYIKPYSEMERLRDMVA